MTIQLLQSTTLPTNRTRVALTPFKTHLVKPLLGTSTPQVFLPSNVEAELFAVLGETSTAPVILSSGTSAETLWLYFLNGTLRATRSSALSYQYPYPQGTCVQAAIAGIDGAPGAPGVDGTNGTNGNRITVGTADPATTAGSIGDIAVNTSTGDFFEKTSATQWTLRGTLIGSGGSGTNGADGSVWIAGEGVPSNTLGKNTDLYVNSLNGDLYKKNNGTWVFLMNIKGPQGISGNNATPGSRWFFGTEDPLSSFGTNIDYYLEIDSGDIWAKATGSWVVIGSMKGVPGTNGSDGAPGYSQAVHFKLERLLAEFNNRGSYVMPTDAVAQYNTVDTAAGIVAQVTTNGIQLPPGSYIMTGASRTWLNFEGMTGYLNSHWGYEPGVFTQVYIDAYNASGASTGLNWVSDFGGYGMALSSTAMQSTQANYGDQWHQYAPMHGVVNLPHGGLVQFRAKADYDTGITHAVTTFTMSVSVLKVQ